jgi:hypothetical protein
MDPQRVGAETAADGIRILVGVVIGLIGARGCRRLADVSWRPLLLSLAEGVCPQNLFCYGPSDRRPVKSSAAIGGNGCIWLRRRFPHVTWLAMAESNGPLRLAGHRAAPLPRRENFAGSSDAFLYALDAAANCSGGMRRAANPGRSNWVQLGDKLYPGGQL